MGDQSKSLERARKTLGKVQREENLGAVLLRWESQDKIETGWVSRQSHAREARLLQTHERLEISRQRGRDHRQPSVHRKRNEREDLNEVNRERCPVLFALPVGRFALEVPARLDRDERAEEKSASDRPEKSVRA